MALLSKRDIDKKINTFFARAREIMGRDYDRLLEKHKVDKKTQPSKLPINTLFSLLNEMNVTLDSVVNDTVDLGVLLHNFSDSTELPSRYVSRATYSSRFTGFYMLDYIQKHFGERSACLTLQHLQLKKSHFSNLALKNNILLSLDITNYVLDYHGEDSVFEMGMNSISHYRNTQHGEILANMTSVKAMLETFFHEFAPETVEKNFDWRVQRKEGNNAYVYGYPKEEIKSEFGLKLRSTNAMGVLRHGFFTALPSIIPGIKGSCRQLKSLSSGDQYDLYEISYSKIKKDPAKGPFWN